MNWAGKGFKFLDRGFAKTLVLVPGWATDQRIFDTLDLDYNYLLPIGISPFDFKFKLFDLLKERHYDNISLFGYSLGGFMVCDFSSEYPHMVEELILLSIRKSYNAKVLKETRKGIKNNRRAFLYKFYLNCFSRYDKEGLAWFRSNLLDSYLQDISADELALGLDYLSSAKIESEKLKSIRKIRLFHGRDDLIAPLQETAEIKSGLTQAKLNLLDNRGHFLFLNKGFRKDFYHG